MIRTAVVLAIGLGLFVAVAQSQAPTLKAPSAGASSFISYEGFLSPAQEPAEESEAPAGLQGDHSGHATEVMREKRTSKGYGLLRFAKDLSKAYVDVQIEGFNPADVVMFHIHCGPPGFLGPIVVDFGKIAGDLSKVMAGNKLSLEFGNKNLTFVKQLPAIGAFKLPESCPTDVGFPAQVNTIAGLEYLARKGVLYFNLHTKAHSFFGEMRGQIYLIKE
jgi:hypothetical protein